MKPIFYLLLLFSVSLQAQSGDKVLTHQDLVTWKHLKTTEITDDGKYVLYTVKPEEGDGDLFVYDTDRSIKYTFERGQNPDISADSRFAVFKIEPHLDSIRAMKRRRVKEKEMPKDTLAIYEFATKNLVKIPNVKSFKLPKKKAGMLVYLREAEKVEDEEKIVQGVGLVEETIVIKKKKENKDNGSKLTIRNLDTAVERTVGYVTDYAVPVKENSVLYYTTSDDTTYLPGVYLFDLKEESTRPLFRNAKYGSFQKLTFSEDGSQLAFVAETDTTKALVKPYNLYYWNKKQDSAEVLVESQAAFLPEKYRFSEHGKIEFSEDGSKLYFGIGTEPILQDTTLLEEEIVNVEVWNTKDTRLYTQQNVELKKDQERSYLSVYHTDKKKFVLLGKEDLPNVNLTRDKNASTAVAYDQTPYQRQSSWEGFPIRKDVFSIDLNTGKKEPIIENLMASVELSPSAQYTFWYSNPDSAWYAHSFLKKETKQLTNKDLGLFYDELSDIPTYAYGYGIAGWMKDDKYIFIYDRFDIWKINPNGKEVPQRLTNGREKQWRYRYVRLDPEKYYFEEKESILVHVFDEKSKGSGYAILNLETGATKDLVLDENYAYGRRPKKAKEANVFIFTKENFETFPDLHLASLNLSSPKKWQEKQFTLINPQQKEYRWGSAELVSWTAYDGQKIEGTLIKPANFDKNKKYPMLVNFYERSSHNLHRHRAPFPHRSTINYSFYASNGYVIFNPDVPYKTGYPGESAYNAVVSGIEAMVEKGFVDAEKIGAQGHSWGGYQVAHLATKTDIFACIESGAPVVNMTSAYGGIRWRSGLNRMFQYERSQSRIGATLWENRDLYIENSPLFNTDKINTPILILHNDKDGAVPWYQGIEWFTALRRLDKPAWMLNYNDEPHWPLKLQNRKDFNIRMQQFFDYYLKEETEMPTWMQKGVPAIEKGINQGLK